MNDQPESDSEPTNPIETEKITQPVPLLRSDTLIMPGGASRMRRLIETQGDDEDIPLAPHPEIFLIIRGMTEQVVLKDNHLAVLGRIDHKHASRPDVDLSRFGAAERGVSREHARLELKDGHLYIVDLASTNGTFFKGERLSPYEPHLLHRSDEVILGRLAVQIMFG